MSQNEIFLIINKYCKHQGNHFPEPLSFIVPTPGVPDSILRHQAAILKHVLIQHSLLHKTSSALILQILDKDKPHAG